MTCPGHHDCHCLLMALRAVTCVIPLTNFLVSSKLLLTAKKSTSVKFRTNSRDESFSVPHVISLSDHRIVLDREHYHLRPGAQEGGGGGR